MLPSFEIYLSILSDSWMPWLDDNRRQEKFESLLFAVRPSKQKHFARFFRELMPALKNTGSTVSAGFMQEVRHLAGMKDARVDTEAASVFTGLPFNESREMFYQALTGQAFDGYRNWLESTLPEKEGEISAYIVTRTAERLQSVLQLPLPVELTEGRELRLLYLVRVAANVLLADLLEYKKKFFRGIITSYQVKEQMQSELHKSRLPAEEREELIRLNEKLQETRLPVIKAKSQLFITGQSKSFKDAEPTNQEPTTDQLQQLSREWQEDVTDIKNAVAEIVKRDTAGKSEKEEKEKMLDSATVMKMLNIHKSTLLRYRSNGTIVYRKIGGKFLYPEKEIVKLLGEKNKK